MAEYNASSIRHLKGLEAVRMRPGMYLGDPSSGDALHHCIKEVVDNSVDEHLAGHCDSLTVALHHDGVVVVSDNGRGIPVDVHPEEGVSALELVMTNLSAGGKFDHDSYETSAGLHGVGVSAVNAVSEWLVAEVHRDGYLWTQRYEAGIPVGPVQRGAASKNHGTTVTWKRDLTVFTGVVEYDAKLVAGRLQELAFLNPGLQLHLVDHRKEKPKQTDFHYAGGIKEYVVDVLGKKTVLTPVVAFRLGNTEIAMAWTTSDGEDIRCYANNTYNRDGGTHLTGFKNGLTRVITAYAKDHNMLKDLGEDGITGNDIRDGIVAVVNVRIPDISFSSQTKDKLVSPRAKTLVEDLLNDQVTAYMEANPGVAKKIADKAVTSAKAREAARRAREAVKRKDFLDPMSLPGKLSDCRSKDPRTSELFIVEGASAAGSAKGGRDSSFQAILPLRGKVLNAERASTESILENGELGTLISVLGCGIEQTGGFKYENLRYHKILIMTDSDVDGAHIRTLLLTFLYRCMPRLIHNGNIFIAQPPLYSGRHSLRGDVAYFLGDAELQAYRDSLPDEGKESKQTLRLQRYKGLGEMNAADLAVTTMDPANRKILQVTVDDASAAEKYFDLLMGDDVANRRDWIEDNAQYASRIDT